ncbi:MAG: hypothetical protein ABWY11_03795, partial [Umezawaea sp.]
DAVIADAVSRGTEALPFDVGDIAGWAVGIYDQNLRHPDLVRLVAWIRLEPPPGPAAGLRPERRRAVRTGWPTGPRPRGCGNTPLPVRTYSMIELNRVGRSSVVPE